MLNENIVQTVETIKKLRQRVDERRNVWSETTKPQIKKCLEQVCKEIDIDLHVVENDLCKNYSSVQLSFGIAPSGIIKPIAGGGARSLRRNPGYLNFAQSINGKIAVEVFYPFVEDLQSEPNALLIDNHEPEDINEALIMSHVAKFLEEIVNWEVDWRKPN
jgi:hypothetical protein